MASGRPTSVDPKLLRKQQDSILAACRLGDSIGLQALIDKDSSISLSYREEQSNATPLHLASEGHHTEVVSILLKYKVDVDVFDNRQSTPLHLAARKGFGDIVRLLLAAGATPDPQPPAASTSASSSSSSSKPSASKETGTKSSDCVPTRTPLFGAVRKDRAKIVSQLLQAGANPNTRQADGRTPLLVAAALGLTNTVETLLESPRIELECALPTGITPLLAAIAGGHLAVVERLLARGASTHAMVTETGETSLHLAASKGHAGIVAALLQVRGCPKHQLDRKGNTPLDLASLAKHNDVVTRLVSARAERHITQKASAALRNVKLPPVKQRPTASHPATKDVAAAGLAKPAAAAAQMRQRYLLLAVTVLVLVIVFIANRAA